jgi:basic membrane protein A
LVFCVGPGFERMVYAEAGGFPDSRFVVLPGRARASNVAGIEFLPDGAGYVAGVVAAHLSDSMVVGVIRGSGGEWLEGLEQGFLSGYRSVRGRGDPVTVAPPEGPRELVARGVGVALYAADQVLPDVLAEAREVGLSFVTTDADLMEADPEVVAAAVHIDVPEAMVRVAREVRDGSFHGGSYVFDFGSGVLDVRINPSHPAATEDPLQEALDVARSEVTAGIVEIEQLGIQ